MPEKSPAQPEPISARPLIRVRGLSKHFLIKRRSGRRHETELLKALDNVSFDIHEGETFGIVGESGSGKTTCARVILRALDATAGKVHIRDGDHEVDLTALHQKHLKPWRRRIQMIFQDPYASLNPRMTVGQLLAEPLLIHRIGRRRERQRMAAEILERVGLETQHMSRYPHAFSGGQRQRIGIARALILRPSVVVADEAVSALDVSVQAQVLDLLRELQHEFGLTYIFVSHDLSVVRSFCDRVAVMYKGRVVEIGKSRTLFEQPRHGYTKVLLSAIPYPDPDQRMKPLRIADLSPEELQPLPDVFDASQRLD
ncbi:MAG: ATP-binding cassette domain-containing protein [Phycisphaerales bacterium]